MNVFVFKMPQLRGEIYLYIPSSLEIFSNRSDFKQKDLILKFICKGEAHSNLRKRV